MKDLAEVQVIPTSKMHRGTEQVGTSSQLGNRDASEPSDRGLDFDRAGSRSKP